MGLQNIDTFWLGTFDFIYRIFFSKCKIDVNKNVFDKVKIKLNLYIGEDNIWLLRSEIRYVLVNIKSYMNRPTRIPCTILKNTCEKMNVFLTLYVTVPLKLNLTLTFSQVSRYT